MKTNFQIKPVLRHIGLKKYFKYSSQNTLFVLQLLEERDTLQLKLSNVMRQFERHKDVASRASTACSTPVPWVDPRAEVVELKHKLVFNSLD